MKMEAELLAADALNEELIHVRGDIQKLNASKHDLSTQVQVLTQDLSRSLAELQQVPAIKAEIEAMKQELQHARYISMDMPFRLHIVVLCYLSSRL